MVDPGMGELVFGPGGVEIRLLTADENDSVEIATGPDHSEHVVRRTGSALQTKSSVQRLDKETGELRAAGVVAEHWNHLVGRDQWTEVRKSDEQVSPAVDVVLVDAAGGECLVQVVRADTDSDRWAYASGVPEGEFVGEDLDVSEAAERLVAAVGHKEASYSTEVKAELVLVLDAVEVPEASDFRVQRLVCSHIGRTAFESIWVCGATSRQVWRIA